MKDKRMLMRVPVLTVTILIALLLLAGTYTVIANSSPSARLAPNSDSAGGPTFWSSGWVTVSAGTAPTFTHNLGGSPDDYAVELWFKDTDGNLGLNRYGYGGLISGTQRYGAYWQRLTANTIQVVRQADDNAADEIRINVWIPPTSTTAYPGPWENIAPGETITLNHNLAITATDLVVSLWFSNTSLGIHQYAYGGLSVNPLTGTLGAYWHNLTNNTVRVTRFPSDTVVEQVRVDVVYGAPPDYDSLVDRSGWQPIALGTTFVFTHNLSWDPNMMMVQGECRDLGGLGINQQFAGGNHHWANGWQGTNIQNVTSNTVAIFRQADDVNCPQARIRISKRSLKTYLPLVMRDYSSP
jgi:hypothetical protein